MKLGALPIRAVVLLPLLCPVAAAPQVADHLKCYKAKDSAAKGKYTANLGGLAPEPGCKINVPGNLICVASSKTNVQPAPPVAGNGGPAGRFLCYKIKCPKTVVQPLQWSDQFGTRTVTPKTPGIICAPEIIPTTTTTTVTTTSTTSTTVVDCGGGGQCPPGSQVACSPPGVCMWGGSACGCVNPTTACNPTNNCGTFCPRSDQTCKTDCSCVSPPTTTTTLPTGPPCSPASTCASGTTCGSCAGGGLCLAPAGGGSAGCYTPSAASGGHCGTCTAASGCEAGLRCVTGTCCPGGTACFPPCP